MGRLTRIEENWYRGYKINNNYGGCLVEILDPTIEIFERMWRVCSKRLFVCHYTIRFKPGFEKTGNTVLSSALHSWRVGLQRRKIRAEYIWCREMGDCSTSGLPHYHLFTVVSGKHIQSAKGIALHLNRLLNNRTGEDSCKVHVNPPQDGEFRWGKKVSEKDCSLEDAINWASYLAKCSGKYAPNYQRCFSYSKGMLKTPLKAERFSDGELSGFEDEDLELTQSEQTRWCSSDVDFREVLNFNPATGGEFSHQTDQEEWKAVLELAALAPQEASSALSK